MKIRHRQSGVELEGKFAEFSQGSIYGKPRNFWIEPSNAASQYSCAECADRGDGPMSLKRGVS